MTQVLADPEVAIHVNETMTRYSSVLYGTAIIVYAIAILLLFAGYAASRRVVGQMPAMAQVGGPTVAVDEVGPGRVLPAEKQSNSQRVINMGYAVGVVGALAHVGSIVTRGFATGRAPWGNMYEFIALTMAACVAGGLIALRAPANRKYLGFVLTAVVIMLVINDKFLATPTSHQLTVPLKSYWLVIHVSIISISSGVLLVSGIASMLYLLNQRFGWFGPEAADRLDRVAYRCVVFAFPLFSLGVICGAIWAESAWGRYWAWDPKEVVSFVAWVVYAAYLHARATANMRNVAAAINVAGFATLLFNLFAINLVISGLHSYAGVGS
ncbi:cytochrome c biogenesis protein CcsA [Gordonia sp. X0973]|uniref:cytochrome c biogenesis protein CcsA n=1 Tax=Gordonia sp. X0973 TaxID=2742602 RepID=UPI000F533FB3|nr:cytochrome c biogenesis protein CcsA [Gordonia sp. X0973]QKT08398.1 cytochrome c biogenesis protein CcsA [Gordonia sp. X0973]